MSKTGSCCSAWRRGWRDAAGSGSAPDAVYLSEEKLVSGQGLFSVNKALHLGNKALQWFLLRRYERDAHL